MKIILNVETVFLNCKGGLTLRRPSYVNLDLLAAGHVVGFYDSYQSYTKFKT